jgi:hypothetical protein
MSPIGRRLLESVKFDRDGCMHVCVVNRGELEYFQRLGAMSAVYDLQRLFGDSVMYPAGIDRLP